METNVIGPIDAPTWYCMRQCREAINYLKSKNDPKYQIEISGEQDLLDHFMDEVLGRKAA
jgi:hypothetical protein